MLLIMLLIDAPNLCHREAFAKAGLTHRDRPSGVIFGALQQVRSLLNRFPGEIAFCWDGPRDRLLRRGFWPGYKANRDGGDVPEAVTDAYPQMILLREEILPRIGLPNQMAQDGYEADDLIAALCRSVRIVKVIVSSDTDLYQLLGPTTVIYNLGRKAGYTARDFMAEYGVTPVQWVEVKSLVGDSSDGIDGVPGVGPKTAVKFILRKASKPACVKIMGFMSVLERNRRLITLPWPGCDPGPVRPSRLDEGEFRRVCAEWGLGSLMK
jgi:DNA polymerase-1